MNSNVALPEEPVDVPLPRSSAQHGASLGQLCQTGTDQWTYALGGAILAVLVVIVSLHVQKYLLTSVPKSSKLPLEVSTGLWMHHAVRYLTFSTDN